MLRFLYFLGVYALQHPLVLATILLVVGYVKVADIDVRKRLKQCYQLIVRRIVEYHRSTRYAYNMSKGPHTWKCDQQFQSPINIEDSRVRKLIIRELLNWNHYDELPERVTLENNGHVLIVRADYRGNRPTLSGADLLACYTFVEMRFHWGWCSSEGSEHTLNNKKYPMELQVMHRTGPYGSTCTSSYDLLMISYFFELSTHNPYLDPVTQNLKRVKKAGTKCSIAPFPLSYLIYPFRTNFYSYGGSLTEPPCYQGTEWFIFPESLAVNEYQLRQFRELCTCDGVTPILRNTRPVQKLGVRVVSLNQFFPFETCHMMGMQDTEEECEEETTFNTTTIITTNAVKVNSGKQEKICIDCNNSNDNDSNNDNKNDNNSNNQNNINHNININDNGTNDDNNNINNMNNMNNTINNMNNNNKNNNNDNSDNHDNNSIISNNAECNHCCDIINLSVDMEEHMHNTCSHTASTINRQKLIS